MNDDLRLALIAVLGAGVVSYHLLHGPRSIFSFLFFFFLKSEAVFWIITPRLWTKSQLPRKAFQSAEKNRGVASDGWLGHNPRWKPQGWVSSCGCGIRKPAGAKRQNPWNGSQGLPLTLFLSPMLLGLGKLGSCMLTVCKFVSMYKIKHICGST